jgi:hypothetical protein
MNQPKIITEFGPFPVKELHWSRYDGTLDSIVSTTEYDPEKSFHETVWDVDKNEKSEGRILVRCSINPKFTGWLEF